MTARNALNLQVGETVDFSVTTRHERFTVVNREEDERGGTVLIFEDPVGNRRAWPAVRLHGVEASEPEPEGAS